MNILSVFLVLILSVCHFSCSQSQDFPPRLLGRCEGCEAVLEYGDRNLAPVDTLPNFDGPGQPIRVSGTVYQADGQSPAEKVVLYVYHTNQEGVYEPREGARDWARRHGYLHAWLKTGPDGRYAFYTRKPAPYPGRTEPAHIHLIVLEPDGKYYWLDSYHFAGDTLLSEAQRNPQAPRGGRSGVLELHREGDLWVGERDIVLGRNVPGYE